MLSRVHYPSLAQCKLKLLLQCKGPLVRGILSMYSIDGHFRSFELIPTRSESCTRTIHVGCKGFRYLFRHCPRRRVKAIGVTCGRAQQVGVAGVTHRQNNRGIKRTRRSLRGNGRIWPPLRTVNAGRCAQQPTSEPQPND
jgi:hypothetical protein